MPGPGPGQVTISVRACGMNPADAKHIAPGQDPALLPLSIGYEVAGVVTALGPDTEFASGGGAAGDEVVAQVTGGYTTAITTSASSVFAKPSTLTFPEAASLRGYPRHSRPASHPRPGRHSPDTPHGTRAPAASHPIPPRSPH